MKKNIVIVILSVVLFLSLIFNVVVLGFYNRPQLLTENEAIDFALSAWRNRDNLKTNQEMKDFITQNFKKQSFLSFSFNKSEASRERCDKWAGYAAHYMDLAFGLLAGVGYTVSSLDAQQFYDEIRAFHPGIYEQVLSYAMAAGQMTNNYFYCLDFHG